MALRRAAGEWARWSLERGATEESEGEQLRVREKQVMKAGEQSEMPTLICRASLIRATDSHRKEKLTCVSHRQW